MSKEPDGTAFDLEKIRAIVELMNDNELTEVDLRSGTQRVRLSKRQDSLAMPMAAAPPVAPHSAPEPKAADTSTEASNLIEVKSPMLGTFYRASSPDADPFVKVGSIIEPDSVIGIIEAMKVFNEIPAEVSGKVVAVLVENAQPVEYGQALLRIDPTI